MNIPSFKNSLLQVLANHFNIASISLVVSLIIHIASMSSVHEQNVPDDEQYKKRPTNAIAVIAQGNPGEAIKNLDAFLTDYPKDAESHYCMAVACAVKNDIPKAMEYVQCALENGMRTERFITGPRDLLKILLESEALELKLKYLKGLDI